MSFDNIVQRLEGVRPYKSSLPSIVKSVRARCPACGGSKTKLNFALKNNGVMLFYCHSLCDISAITDAIGINVSDLFPFSQTLATKNSSLQNTVRGWDWWSMVSALELLSLELTSLTFKLTEHLPVRDPARQVMADAVGSINELAARYQYGKGK